MDFPADYFEDEVRDGFYVPSMIKHAWAAQIEVLKEVTDVCDRHGIRFFADWGTMLGAVRHGGYIPWDDDLDILMLRKDYVKFLEVAPKELPENYVLHNIYKERDYDNFLTRVNNESSLCTSGAFLEKYHQFPCTAGLDVFVVDYLPRDEVMQDQLQKTIQLIYSLRYQIEDVPDEEKDDYLCPLEDALGVNIDRDGDLMHQLGLLYEQIGSMYREDESDIVTCMTLWSTSKRFGYPKTAFDKRIKIPFENYEIPVAAGYEKLLRMKFGNYMKQVRDHNSHNYPYFLEQYEEFERLLKKKKYEPSVVYPRRYEDGRKLFLEGQCAELMGIMDELSSMLGEAKNFGNQDAISQIDEQIKIVTENATAVLDALENRKEVVVFLPAKAEWWSGLSSLWEEVANSEDKLAYVVPLTFFEKNVFGFDTVGFYDLKRFPKETYPIPSDQIDLEQLHPDKIYIQVPFDAYNDGFRIQEEYYSDKLRNICDQLIYVPYFTMDDVTSEDRRALMHIKHLCDTPVFANADQIWVQSDIQKKTFIEHLTTFFGEDSRVIFEEKLVVAKLPILYFDVNASYRNSLPEEYFKKKHLVFHMGIATFLDRTNDAIEKVKSVLTTFEDSKEKITVHWILDRDQISKIREYEKAIAFELEAIMKDYSDRGIVSLEELTDRKKILALNDAYYGDASFIADMFASSKKPVMIMDLES